MQNAVYLNDQLLTRKQALELLEMSKVTLWRRVKDSSIKQTKVGRKTYFKYSDLLQMGTPTEQPLAAETV